MIHLLLVLDREKSVGLEIYNDRTISFQSDLLIGLVQALMLLGQELGESKGPLREAELGSYQISILSRDHIAYIAIQDTYDSEPFTKRILDGVVTKYHEYFRLANFNQRIDDEEEIRETVAELLVTMKFPTELLPEILPLIDEFNSSTNNVCDTLFLADLDDGIVHIWSGDSNDPIIKILMEILSEIDPERTWIGESKLLAPRPIEGQEKAATHENWFMIRIGTTDFCIMGRAYYSHGLESELLSKNMDLLSEKILNKIMDSGLLKE
ncbi:MAG: hypothetical protein HeimC2_04450 [Candidatus Heimdallarchaeota archaeon LC_2]|nr:MAG: hypothetical protein HeimC2_04450 [Candidatus Heimdallarchaeota archaeon LC_2]